MSTTYFRTLRILAAWCAAMALAGCAAPLGARSGHQAQMDACPCSCSHASMAMEQHMKEMKGMKEMSPETRQRHMEMMRQHCR